MRFARIVNVVPKDHSNETNDDAEPSIAVNPNNPDEMVVTAFTPPEGANVNGPVFYSSNGGEDWSMIFAVPGGESNDQSPAFTAISAALYMGTLRGASNQLNALRSVNPAGVAFGPPLETRPPVDQPWVEAIRVKGGADAGKDRLYLGYNDLGHRPQTATVDVCLDAAAPAPSFTQVRLDPRSASSVQNGYEIRPTAHRDGTVYVAYKGWRAAAESTLSVDIVVARDDNWGTGAAPFKALTDPGDGLAGRVVAARVPIIDPANLGNIGGGEGVRLNNDLNIAVDPNNSNVVYIVWCDNSGSNYTLRVRRSINRGANWSPDLIAVNNAALACLAINGRGTIGLLYQQLVGGRMETHFRTSSDGASWDDMLLARTSTTSGFLGDYARLVGVANDFYGVFPAMNAPDPANFFPSRGGTLRYQRNTRGASLVGSDGTTPVGASVDPFFVKVQERDCVVTADRSTFTKDEIDAMLRQANPTPPQTNPAIIGAAFHVVVDGFRAKDLAITTATFSGTPDVKPGVVFSPPPVGMSVQAVTCSASEDQTNLTIPQRFTWTYQIVFANDNDFSQERIQFTMMASITSTTSLTVSAQAVIALNGIGEAEA
jgi:hypothetical protein